MESKIECCVCHELLLQTGEKVSAGPCGHVFHTTCVEKWYASKQNKAECPVCRKAFQLSACIPIHLPVGDDDRKDVDVILNFVKNYSKHSEENKSWMDYVVDSLNNITTVVTDLKKENAEIKTKVSTLETVTNPSSDQLRAKDAVIAGLKKEVQELKAQRAEAAKQMHEIQKQIIELKKNKDERGALNVKNTSNSENQQPTKEICLSMKFDDISDRMILGDF